MTTAPSASLSDRFRSLRLTPVRAVVGATLAALVVNLAIWLLGLAAGSDFMVSDGEGGRMPAAPSASS